MRLMYSLTVPDFSGTSSINWKAVVVALVISVPVAERSKSFAPATLCVPSEVGMKWFT
jgi:hypothetical protein